MTERRPVTVAPGVLVHELFMVSVNGGPGVAEPAWLRYRNDSNALRGIIAMNTREAFSDIANAEWYVRESADIRAYLERTSA